MILNYNDWLMGKLVKIAKASGFDNIKFHIFNEQDFTKQSQLNKNDIFVIIKNMPSSIMYNAKINPLQILIMSDENSIQIATLIFKKFVSENNWAIIVDGKNYIKQQYTDPVVLNNFMQVGIGYRSVMYISATLYELENVVDIENLRIDGEEIKPISFNISYTLQQDTQQMPDTFFATSVRTCQVLAFALTIPAKESIFLKKAVNIVKGDISGDEKFNLKFNMKGIEGEFNYNVRVSGYTMSTAPNEIPTIMIGLVL